MVHDNDESANISMSMIPQVDGNVDVIPNNDENINQ